MMYRVPGVVIETGLRIAQVPRNKQELTSNIVHRRRISMTQRVLRIERLGHVQAVEPHLLRIDLLVPESALRRSRLRSKLLAECVRRLRVSNVVSGLEQKKQHSSFVDLIEIELGWAIALDRAIGMHERIDALLQVARILAIVRRVANALDPEQDETRGVVPLVIDDRIARDHRLGDPDGPWFRALRADHSRRREDDAGGHRRSNPRSDDHLAGLPLIVVRARSRLRTFSITLPFVTFSK